jgi:CubicO group peptidase (beta-lactamase class C family)
LIHRALSYPDEPTMAAAWYTPTARIAGDERPFAAAPDALPADVLDRMQAWAADRRTRGLVVLRHGALVREWYAPGFDATSLGNGQSLVKTVDGLLLGIAIADGSIGSVDDPVARYVPEWADDPRSAITLRDLLTLSSGLRNETKIRLGSDIVTLFAGTHVERAALRIPAKSPPGMAFDYASVDAQIAGIVLERATGRTYADHLSEKLWKPIGAGEARVWLDRDGGMARTFCCTLATARDWARVGQLILDGGQAGGVQVVPAAWIDAMKAPSATSPDYGLFLWRVGDRSNPFVADCCSEPALDPGMSFLAGLGQQRVYVIPEADAVVVRIGEEPDDWDDAVLPNAVVRAVRDP